MFIMLSFDYYLLDLNQCFRYLSLMTMHPENFKQHIEYMEEALFTDPQTASYPMNAYKIYVAKNLKERILFLGFLKTGNINEWGYNEDAITFLFQELNNIAKIHEDISRIKDE